MSNEYQSERVLVTGAEGMVGRELVRMLVRAGALVRAGTHDRASLTGADSGLDMVLVDFERPATLVDAMAEVEVLYLVTPQVPASVDYVRAAVAAARTSGVGRIVRQSVYNAADGEDAIARWHREAEATISSSGLSYAFLRPNAFMQNFVSIYRRSIVEHDSFSLPLGTARLSNIDTRDIAAAATGLLLDDDIEGTVFTLTGPEALTGHEMAAVLSEATGRLISYRDEPEEAGSPEPAAAQSAARLAEREALRELGTEMRAGRLAAVTGDLERLTGRPPISFEQFARDNVWAFARGAGELRQAG